MGTSLIAVLQPERRRPKSFGCRGSTGVASSKQILFVNLAVRVLAAGHHPIITASTTFLPLLQLRIQAASEQTRKPRATLGFPTNQGARPGRSVIVSKSADFHSVSIRGVSGPDSRSSSVYVF